MRKDFLVTSPSINVMVTGVSKGFSFLSQRLGRTQSQKKNAPTSNEKEKLLNNSTRTSEMYAVTPFTNCWSSPFTVEVSLKRGIDIADEASLTTVLSKQKEISRFSAVAMYFAMNSLHRLSREFSG